MKARAALGLALAWAAACQSVSPVEVRVQLPGVAALPAGSFDEIVVADFREAAPVPGLAVGRGLGDFLAAEIGRAFRKPVARCGPADEAPARPRERAIVLSGEVALVGEVRKALDKGRAPLDGPFKAAGRALVEQLRWTMTVDLVARSAADGTVLFRRVFRDERDYLDLEKPAEFAFAELSDRLRARLLPLLLGAPTWESRALLRR
ncbi:MAG TPA: hypothetical protein PLP83_02765 [Candidatus Aminicenantes bacterium]|nr:hypothetical protein [Candidatus Aminicenantes bacterium]